MSILNFNVVYIHWVYGEESVDSRHLVLQTSELAPLGTMLHWQGSPVEFHFEDTQTIHPSPNLTSPKFHQNKKDPSYPQKKTRGWGKKQKNMSLLGHVLRFSISVVPIFHRKIPWKIPSTIFKIRWHLWSLISRSSFCEIKGIPGKIGNEAPKVLERAVKEKKSSSQSSKDLTFFLGCENIIYLYKQSCKTHWKIAIKMNGKTAVVQAWFFFRWRIRWTSMDK